MNLDGVLRRRLLTLLSPAGRRARLMILSFHQVRKEVDPLAPDVPTAAVFAEQMRWLADYCNVLPLVEATDRFRAGTLPARSACITFDDGYADNVEVAAPILKGLGLPATFFVTTGAIEAGIMWNDLAIEGIRCASEDFDLTDLGFVKYRLKDEVTRCTAIHSIISRLKYRPLEARVETARVIFERASAGPAPRLMMTAAQVAELAASGFDIGAHTVNHPILKELPDEMARREIEASRDWVRDVTGELPLAFAYPNGRPGIDFNDEHERMVHQAGFRVAVSTRWACAKPSDSLFALPRFAPWERERAAFWRRLGKMAVLSYLERNSAGQF